MDYSQPALCLALLHKLHPIDFRATQETLARMVEGLLEAKPAPNQHLEVLEAARDTLSFAQGELARSYCTHPLPPDQDENNDFGKVASLWQAMARSYTRIAEADREAGTLNDQRALLAQRRLFYQGQVLVEHFRAHRSVVPGTWRALHAAYTSAVALGVAGIRVSEPLNPTWRAQSPQEAYIATLLVELANPYGRNERELNWVMRWAQRFAPYCALDTQLDAQKPTAYGVDTASDTGLRPLGLLAHTPSLLRFDGSALATQIQAMLAQFKRGVKPASLGLGSDCSTNASARLLLSLYRPWGLASSGRRFPRRSKQGEIGLTGDWLGIGFAIKGELFQQPQTVAPKGRLREDISLFTFGERVPLVESTEKAQQRRESQALSLGFDLESWSILDQSVGGFRLESRTEVARLEHHQLVGIRPPDMNDVLIGDLSWLMYRADSTLEIGINILPGKPRVVAARQLASASRTPFHQTFVLPATPALKAPASIVLPSMWFQADRIIEVRDDDQVRQFQLRKLMVRGTNYDQCSFEPVESALNPT